MVGSRDALLARRLAGARRRADVHRLAQPEGLHRGEARPRGRDRPLRRLGDPGRAAAGRRGPGRARTGSEPRRGRGGRHLRPVPGGGAAVHRRRRRALVRAPAESGRGRRQRHGGADGRAAAREPRAGADRELLEARRRVPRPRAEPAAAREPRASSSRRSARAAPTSGSPGTATPTAASSSTRPGGSSTATS